MALDHQTIQGLVQEARASGFKDQRLRARLANIVEKIAASPDKSFPKMFSSAELEGAYRFFGNPLVTCDDVLSGHFDSVAKQARASTSVLVIHDSTVFNFDAEGERIGLGRARVGDQAFHGHFSLVLKDDGSRHPIGMAAVQTWVRNDDPAAPKEKDRWANGVDLAASRLPSAKLLHVMDRGADDYTLFAHLVRKNQGFLVRLMHDRVLEKTLGGVTTRISDVVTQVECVFERTAKLSKRKEGGRSPTQKSVHPSRAARVAKLAVGAIPLKLPRPKTTPNVPEAELTLNLVRVWESEAPEGVEPIEWLLITNEPADTAADLRRLVDAYRARWTIEEFFKVLKTGCSYMKRQLEDYEGLVNALAVSTPIACKALLLRTIAREQPRSEQTILDEDHLLVLREKGRTKLPPNPTNRDILLAIAALGGHIKWNGEPGWKTICSGLEDLLPMTEGFRIARKLLLGSDQ